ncbi:MAG TPA: nucleotide disphospho-sugar-binding domain-containing protein [Vicinamibacterales bacterium]|nr:nucleotide disphospho-sugar-binding domain-containing protein [Vicinamibacterales bacterium]
MAVFSDDAHQRQPDRRVFEPLAFFGSLAADPAPAGDGARSRRRWFDAGVDEFTLFASFGTNIWISRTAEALRALAAIADWAAAADDARVLISLGAARLAAGDRARLERPHVRVADYVDQREVLECADAFVTHHGLNSTHEAVVYEVPMISYPFVWDQPGLAAACQRLGLAVPLADTPMAPVAPDDVQRAVTTVRGQSARFAEALARAHEWEREVIASRPAVLRQVLDLCGRG